MVDYPEPWMDSVETMKSLQGWTDTSILHFRDMALYGEKILLSVRYGAWTDEIHPENAANWAGYWACPRNPGLSIFRLSRRGIGVVRPRRP